MPGISIRKVIEEKYQMHVPDTRFPTGPALPVNNDSPSCATFLRRLFSTYVEHAQPEQIEVSPTVPLSLDRLQSIHLALHGPIAPYLAQGCCHRRFVLPQT